MDGFCGTPLGSKPYNDFPPGYVRSATLGFVVELRCGSHPPIGNVIRSTAIGIPPGGGTQLSLYTYSCEALAIPSLTTAVANRRSDEGFVFHKKKPPPVPNRRGHLVLNHLITLKIVTGKRGWIPGLFKTG